MKRKTTNSGAHKVERLLARKRGILLDISLGGTAQEGSVTMQELGHDPRRLPYPLPTGSVHTARVNHVLEYLAPSQFFAFWDEVHRVMRPHGVVYVIGPYGGDESAGWLSDPLHQTRVIEQSFAWLDPRLPFYALHGEVGRPQPKPWHSLMLTRIPAPNNTVGYNVMLSAQPVNGHGRTNGARAKS